MDSDQGKLFIGGISLETNEDKLNEYFGQYGDILQTVVMRDKITGRPRGFGFVVFSDPSVLDTVLQEKHTIDGRTVEAKRALSREEKQTSARSGNVNQGRNSGSDGGNTKTKKIFVGGLPPTLSEDGFREYFEAYGHVTDVVIMYDHTTQRPRGFGFISFDSEDAVDRVLDKTFHDLCDKQVEVKRALPKDANPGGVSCSISGGSYQGFGGNGGSYDGRMDSNRYMQAQSAGAGFPPNGSSGYCAPGYSYGAANNAVGYGGYGNHGGAAAAYGGPAGAAYGNPDAGYVSGPVGAPRGSWGTQTPSGYGTMGYGNAAPWGTSSAGAISGGPGSAVGYGGYGGNDGSYGNAGCGAAGGRSGGTPNCNSGAGGGDLQGSGGYMGSGYGDANGNSGYGNASWRSDSSQGSGNYGTMGYGNAAPWGTSSAGAVSGGPGSAGGYGGYGGNDGSYGNAGYGAAGGRSGGTPNSNSGAGGGGLQGSGGYMGSGYGDANGNSGYGNASWRSDSSQGSGNYGGAQTNGPHGGQVGYGGGYGQQAQQ